MNAEDPYAPPPPAIWQTHGNAVSAVAVFVATVVLTVCAFPPYHSPEFAYAMLVPGVLWCYRRPPFRLFVWTMFAAQAVAWTILLWWLHNVTWAGLLLLGPIVGAWVGSWFLAAYWTMPRMLGRTVAVRLVSMLGLAGMWVLIEWTRSWFLGGFPWLPLAASQWERVSVLQIAAYTGAGGVSFVLVAVNIGFAAYGHRLFKEGQMGLAKRSQEFFLAMFLLLICLCVHVTETYERGRFRVALARIGIVQPYIPQSVKWDPAQGPLTMEVLAKLTLDVAAARPDLILWPESVTPWAVREDSDVRLATEALAARAGAPIVFGSIGIDQTPGGEVYTNGAFVVDPKLKLQGESYAKRQLVPFGEFVPFRPVLGWLHKVVDVGENDFQPGTDPSPLAVNIRGGEIQLMVGPLICYEDTFASLARDSVLAGADLLVVLTNNAWFGEGGAAYQHAAHAVLRAVENRRPVVRVGNGGWSGWIDEFGSIQAVVRKAPDGVVVTKPAEEGTIYFRGDALIRAERDYRWIQQKSFYTRKGEWFLVVAGFLAVLTWSLLRLVKPRVAEDLPEEAR